MNTLTEEQRQAIKADGEPLRLIDPETNEEYVVIRAAVFDRLQGMRADDSPFNPREAYVLAEKVFGPAGWDDPAMDIYNDLDPRKQP